jgi:Ca2+-binding RTX toxin-like protein
MKARGILACGLVISSMAAASAEGATRYAEPEGNGPEATCPKSNACSILDAIEGPTVANGDVIRLARGRYEVAETLNVGDEITVTGTRGKPRRTTVTPTADLPNFVHASSRVTLRDFSVVAFDTSPANLVFAVDGGVLERMFIAGTAARACNVSGTESGVPTTVRSTVCWTDQVNQTGLSFGADGGDDFIGVARNVTAISTGGGTATGLRTAVIGAGSSFVLDARNVIASGTTDVGAEKAAESEASTIDLRRSNFQTRATDPGALITAPDEQGNQIDPPLLVDPENGDFTQRRASPTRDAGGKFPDVGLFDLNGHARTQKNRPDIGAFEFTAKRCLGRAPTAVGRNRGETLLGTGKADVLLALSGRDRLKGRGGKDRLCGGGGRDKLQGGNGRDRCDGGSSSDTASTCERARRIP